MVVPVKGVEYRKGRQSANRNQARHRLDRPKGNERGQPGGSAAAPAATPARLQRASGCGEVPAATPEAPK